MDGALSGGSHSQVKACHGARSVVMLQSANVVGETWGARIAIPRHCSGSDCDLNGSAGGAVYESDCSNADRFG